MAKKPPAKKVSKKAPIKKSSAKKPVLNKAPAKKAPSKKVVKKAPAKPAAKKPVKIVAKKAPVKSASKPTKVVKPVKVVKGKAKAKPVVSSNIRVLAQQFVRKPKVNKNLKLTPFLAKQHKRLLDLKDVLLDSMSGVAHGNLHAGSETSAFGMHQADAGSDAYDRDFALSMLSKEQGSLYEIDEALKRIEDGSYGVCEICEKPIKHDRLEALPFTRYTVDCQAELEKRQHHNSARPQITSLFGLTEEESESEEEDTTEPS
jgi:RNA polymerase-binding transcription factor DksA